MALAAVPPAAAQAEGELPVIREVRFEGLESLTAETLQFYLGLEVGQRLAPAKLNDRVHELWDRRLVDDIRIAAEPREDGVTLVITVVERPTLRSIEYQGLKKVNRTDVADRIAKDRIQVREGSPLSLGELRRLERAIEELYEEKGFRLADAEFRIERLTATDRSVIFTIDEGDKVRIDDIDFEGNTVFSDRRLRWAMKKTKESGLIMRLFKKDIYKPAAFDEDLDKVRDLYKREGYKNVVLGDPEIEVRARRPDAASADSQKRRLYLTVPVEEGARWKLGELSVEGNERFSDELLLRQFKRPRGGWLRSKVIDEGLEAIQEIYSNTGHIFARVDPVVVEQAEQVADLVIQVDEGDQFSVGRIEFSGNAKTKDKVLRRELGLHEGMVLNSGALRNSLLRIRQLEFFKIDEEDPVTFEFDNEAKTVDLVLKGEEGDRTELLFGGGFSEIDGFFGQFAFKSRNFLGRGETLGVSVQSGARQDVFDLSYFVPWFLDRPQSIGIQAFRRKQDFNLLADQRIRSETIGGTLSYGRNLSLFRRLSVSYSRFEQEDFRRQLSLTGELVEQEFSREVSMIQVAQIFDRRDSRLEPTRGMRYSVGLDVAGSVLGGTTEFIRPQASFSLFKPVTRKGLLTVAAVNVEVGYVEPIEDAQLFFLDRFYAGGQNSIRGFRYRGIWVRDDNDRTVTDEFGFPLGGTSSFQTNLEYHFVPGGPFRFIIFGDAGNVYDKENLFDIGRLRYSTGIELRVNVPLFGAPLRFIYAINLEPLPDDRFESFQFSVGPSF